MNLSGISPLPRRHCILDRVHRRPPQRLSLHVDPGEIARALPANKMQGFVAGLSVAYAFIGEEQLTGPAINRTSEQGTAMKRNGTVAMNYIQLSAYERSDEGAGSRYLKC